MDDQTIIDEFHRLWRRSQRNDLLNFMGRRACKTPMDLWVYQEILWELKPDLVIECGTYEGGTAHYLACMMDVIGHGNIMTIDIQDRNPPQHPRIKYLLSGTVDKGFQKVQKLRAMYPGHVLVILDSSHQAHYVLQEMKLYAPLVTKGSYMIVEDSDLNGHPAGDLPYWRAGDPGPHEAIEQFLGENDEFVIDSSREKFYVTVCKDGYLKKVK